MVAGKKIKPAEQIISAAVLGTPYGENAEGLIVFV